MSAHITPAQTVGPFFHDCLLRGDNLAEDAHGERIAIHGSVHDGDGTGVPDAVLEFWHADHFVRARTDAAGAYSIRTSRPAPTADGLTHAAHISVAIFARGLLNHLVTRMYFPDEESNGRDPILLRVPPARRSTLVARQDRGGEGEAVYVFDVVLQGAGETVFFDFK